MTLQRGTAYVQERRPRPKGATAQIMVSTARARTRALTHPDAIYTHGQRSTLDGRCVRLLLFFRNHRKPAGQPAHDTTRLARHAASRRGAGQGRGRGHQAVRQGHHHAAAAGAAPRGSRRRRCVEGAAEAAAAGGGVGARGRRPAGGGRAGARRGGRGAAAVPAVPEPGHQVLLLQQLQRQPAAPLLPGLPPLLDGRRRHPQRARRLRPPQEPPGAAAAAPSPGAARRRRHRHPNQRRPRLGIRVSSGVHDRVCRPRRPLPRLALPPRAVAGLHRRRPARDGGAVLVARGGWRGACGCAGPRVLIREKRRVLFLAMARSFHGSGWRNEPGRGRLHGE
ncbi:hypothetical protein PVAP13_3NG258214 [Panicum virgatum]|uniref:Uncharacterized protein n=1 Tax=Panicum virgatum TaxID=38727 RepID=A0A8T0UCK7_PANVG|nr:hypothetical protein PVAP13_3NG258214 [Panicum virgatum]